MNHSRWVQLGALIWAAIKPALCLAIQFNATDLGTLLGGPNKVAGTAINNYGQVVGTAYVPPSGHLESVPRAFLWTPTTANGSTGSMTELPLLSDPALALSKATGINDLGQVVGSNANANYERPFLWTPASPNGNTGTIFDLNNSPPGYDKRKSDAINSMGQVGGTDFYNTTNPNSFLWTPAILNGSSGMSASLGPQLGWAAAINAQGQVAGTVGTPNSAALFTPATANAATGTTNLIPMGPGITSSNSVGMNDAGQVVGYAFASNPIRPVAFLWTPETPNGITGTTTLFPTLRPSSSSWAFDINNLGQTVGWANAGTTTFTGHAAVLWTADGEIINLNDSLYAPLPAGWILDSAVAINDYSQIVATGYYWDGDPESTINQYHAFLLTPLPEPILLPLLGILTLLLRRVRANQTGQESLMCTARTAKLSGKWKRGRS